MVIEEVDARYKHYLAYAEPDGQVPILYGFSTESSRDQAYDQFLQDGEIDIMDPVTGLVKTVYPMFMIKLDAVSGKWATKSSGNWDKYGG